MGDITWSVKMPEELKEKISEKLQETGLTGKDFIDSLLTAYELQQVKTSRPEIAPDLMELEKITKRICSIYANMGERINTVLVDKDNFHITTIGEKDKLIIKQEENILSLQAIKEELEERISQAEGKIDTINKDRAETEAHYVNHVNQLSEVNLSNKDLIEEYKKKIDTMSGLLSEYETYKSQIQTLKAELETEKDLRKEAQASNKVMAEDLNKTNMVIIKTVEEHKEQITRIKEQCEFQKEKALLEQEKTFRKEMQVQTDEYNKKIKELLQELNESRKAPEPVKK